MSQSDEHNSQPKGASRRPYAAPRIARVDLEAEQVLAAGCKTEMGGTGPLPPGCLAGSCGGIGS